MVYLALVTNLEARNLVHNTREVLITISSFFVHAGFRGLLFMNNRKMPDEAPSFAQFPRAKYKEYQSAPVFEQQSLSTRKKKKQRTM